ncbi:MAG: hypothetical protein KKB31_07345 [Nanoarchaeota archaeon]|nr:hypothetical protein [Nanoarchaeota archaeon]
MTDAKTGSGIGITWGAEHRTGDGRLISKQVSLEPPAAPTCIRPKCLIKYLWVSLTFALIASYHARRTAYAEKNRNKVILERYRTGEPSPDNLIKAIYANIKLTCPVCRKINTGGW